MHGMLSACSLLLDTPLTPHQRESASIIGESGQVLLRVINDILDYSKLASGSFSINADVVGIRGIITSVVRSEQTTLRPDVTFEVDLDPSLPKSVQGKCVDATPTWQRGLTWSKAIPSDTDKWFRM